MKDLEARPVPPALQDFQRLVGGVVDDDDLVFGVFEMREGGQQALDDALFVVRGDVDRYERVIAEVDVVAVAIAVDTVQRLAVCLGGAVAVARRRSDQCREQHHRRAQVVLDRIGEEDSAENRPVNANP